MGFFDLQDFLLECSDPKNGSRTLIQHHLFTIHIQEYDLSPHQDNIHHHILWADGYFHLLVVWKSSVILLLNSNSFPHTDIVLLWLVPSRVQVGCGPSEAQGSLGSPHEPLSHRRSTRHSASPCQFCNLGSCSSRSWCVSQAAGDAGPWRWCQT